MNKKEMGMKAAADLREKLYKDPKLVFLFLELTMNCNEHCIHCGSKCGDVKPIQITKYDYMRLLDKVAHDFDTKTMMLCITGGEPLLAPDFFEIMRYAKSLGFSWGMTSNGTLIDEKMCDLLYDAGMKTISISIDGLEATNDWFRQTKGGYERAMKGVKALVDFGKFQNVQVSTVVHHKNIDELDKLYDIFSDIDIDSWRLISLEPIGRAKEHPEILLRDNDYKTIFDFIKEKRENGDPLEYGCTHYLGLEYENELRDWYFSCNAGILTASVMANGDIGACLDIERNEHTIMGNILKDDFTEVWNTKFEVFRQNKGFLSKRCKNCKENKYCQGGSCHTWDFFKNEQEICMKSKLKF